LGLYAFKVWHNAILKHTHCYVKEKRSFGVGKVSFVGLTHQRAAFIKTVPFWEKNEWQNN
jgi:hypothetical protein